MCSIVMAASQRALASYCPSVAWSAVSPRRVHRQLRHRNRRTCEYRTSRCDCEWQELRLTPCSGRDGRLASTSNLPGMTNYLLARASQWARCRPCQLRAKERSQPSITHAARDTETAESFGRDWLRETPRIAAPRLARNAEKADPRVTAILELVARTGDRTRKGQRLLTPAFRITLR